MDIQQLRSSIWLGTRELGVKKAHPHPGFTQPLKIKRALWGDRANLKAPCNI